MCIFLHNNRVSISGNMIYFLTCFCPNTGTKFREPYHSNHVIPRLEVTELSPTNIYDMETGPGLTVSSERPTECRI